MRMRTLLIGVLAVNFAAALAPFRFDVPRYVTNRLDREHAAWRFAEPSLAATPSAPSWVDEVRRTATITINLTVRPEVVPQSGPARILTTSQNFNTRNLTIAQEGPDLHVRLRRPGSDVNGMPALIVPDVFRTGEWRDVAVAVRPGLVTIRVDGTLRAQEVLSPNALSRWDQAFPLALGNEVIGERPWVGQIATARISTPTMTVDLLAPGYLDVPEGWWHVPERLRAVMRVNMPADAGVALLHLVAFVPVGYLLSRIRRQGHLLDTAVVLKVGVLSLAIELVKVMVDGRHPSLLNFAAQLLGGVIGAVMGVASGRTQPSVKPERGGLPHS